MDDEEKVSLFKFNLRSLPKIVSKKFHNLYDKNYKAIRIKKTILFHLYNGKYYIVIPREMIVLKVLNNPFNICICLTTLSFLLSLINPLLPLKP